jgi:predicted nucleic acid-binding protein
LTLIDTNVLLDIVTRDPIWADWSLRQLDAAALRGPLAINEIVYAELSVRFQSLEALDERLDDADILLLAAPRPALFLAGKVFQRYRTAGGSRTSILPDFFIGAHAAILEVPLVTRDSRRYRTYYPTLRLICP